MKLPKNAEETSKVISELLAKSCRNSQGAKTLQRTKERQAENEMLRKRERNLEENGSNCFNTSEIEMTTLLVNLFVGTEK